MKRIIFGIFILYFYLNTFALNESCFEYIGTTDIPQNEIFLLNSDRNLDYAKSGNTELYMKLYKQENSNLDYDVNINSNEKASIQDGIISTYYEYYIGANKESSIKFDLKKQVGPGVSSKIDIESRIYNYIISVSKDDINYENVNINNLNTFSFRYLKISFVSYGNLNNSVSENVKIKDISFTLNKLIYLVKANANKNIKLYSNFYCSNDKDYKDLQKYNTDNIKEEKSLMYKSGLKSIDISLIKNISYSLDKGTDTDFDGINDEQDNCKNDYNPNQYDYDTNGVGDLCDDNDSDGIMGKSDNCPFNSNPDQLDVNNNKIGDVCEFDKDKDSIFDSQDNCINKANPDQLDDDSDGIGNVCDNCKLYNPTQIDKNNNKIGDTCEETEKYEKENDKDKDGVIDYNDNCREVSNTKQEDSDLDGIGDVCDNCKDIRNDNQIDDNKNGIGDLCEDSDSDGILGYLDNCINIPNADQADSDNNGIGDICEDIDNDGKITYDDNCPYEYNPDQKDIDNDKIGDACDTKDDRFIESNKQFFITFLVLVVLGFLGGIYLMIKKLKTIQK